MKNIIAIFVTIILLFATTTTLACEGTQTQTQVIVGDGNANNGAVIQNSTNVTVTQNAGGKKYYTTRNENVTNEYVTNEYHEHNEYVTNEYYTTVILQPLTPTLSGEATVSQQIVEINNKMAIFLDQLRFSLDQCGYDVMWTPEQTNRNGACAYSVTFVNRTTLQTSTRSLILYSHNSGYLNRPYLVAMVSKYQQGMKIMSYDTDMVVFREVDTEEARTQIKIWLEIACEGAVYQIVEDVAAKTIAAETETTCCCCGDECNCCCCCPGRK